MRTVDNSTFDQWMQLYSKAWINRNPDLIIEIFDKSATYSEKPFSPPFEGIDEIKKYWQGVCQTQKDITFEYQIISVNDNTGIAHFEASFLRQPGTVNVKLDGIFKVVFNSENKCTSFSEWWQSQKS